MAFLRDPDRSKVISDWIYYVAKATRLFSNQQAVEQAIKDGTFSATIGSDISISCQQCDYVSIRFFLFLENQPSIC